jgi:hypothetical protein
MYEHLKFVRSVFWRWLVVSFISSFVGEMISTGVMHKGWVQMPVAFLTLFLALAWFFGRKSRSGQRHDAKAISIDHVGSLSPFALRFTWDIFWRWYLVEFAIHAVCSLVFQRSSFAMIWVQQIASFPALIAALFWVQKSALNLDVSGKNSQADVL